MDVNEDLKFLRKFFFFGGVGGVRLRVGQGRCERRSEVFVKIKKIYKYIYIYYFFWGVVVVRVDVNEELKFL